MGNRENIQKGEKEVTDNLTKLFRGSGIGLFNDVVVSSPVDSGRFRANWTPTLNKLAVGTTDALNAQNIVKAVGNAKLGDTLHLTNNLPYALPLEQGWSKQQPSGWIRLRVADAQKYIADAVKKLGIS